MESICGEIYWKDEGECRFCPLDKDECQYWIERQIEQEEFRNDERKENGNNNRTSITDKDNG